MHVNLKMPDLATTESEIKVVRWLVEVGQPVAQGQVLMEVETDKATMDVEAYLAGTVRELVVQPGDTVAVGQVVARLEVNAGAGAGVESQPAVAVPAMPPPAAPPRAPGAAAARGGMFARNRAAAAATTAASLPPVADSAALPLSVAARTAARRLQASKQTVPHFYLQTSANAEPMLARQAAAQPQKLAWDAFFVHAVSRALAAFPKLACRFENEQLVPQGTDSIGVAVDLADDLFVVSVPAPDGTTPEQLSAEIRAGVEALRSGAPDARRLTRNRMTITNLGMTGVEAFAAIINPPEAAILAVGTVAPVVVAVAGQPVVQNRVQLTLSVDHRVAGGKYAAGFLQCVVAELEAL